VRGITCHSSCVTCSGAAANQCSSCAGGYILSFGSCVACDSSCKTCNGTTALDCTNCYSGRYLSNGQCSSCYLTCLECVGSEHDNCSACLPDSVLKDGQCQCTDGLVRHPTSHRCVDRCPSGFESNGDNYCSNSGQYVYDWQFAKGFSFENSSHPPSYSPDRGAYFNGESSTIQLTDFELYREHSLEIWVRLYDINASICSFRGIPTWEGFSSLELNSNSNRWPTATSSEFYCEMSLNRSGYIEFSTDNFTTGNAYRYDGSWVHLAVSTSTDAAVESMMTSFYINGSDIGSTTSSQVIFDNFDRDNYLGSTYGVINNMNGLMYSFRYAA
jgi:hypothetical protein